ncbi:MAG: hypothetical protein M3Z09_04340, partial [Acidobacteriota bacterium]|nr:hypothetical protein [Acidobacteriota bacterium]
MKRKIVFSLMSAFPIALFAFSTGPPAKRTGAAVDGGLNCTACHTTYAPANSDSRGSISLTAFSYTPGTPQTITVNVQHPEAARWGFQLIARTTADQTVQAGTFTVDDTVRVRCVTGDSPCKGGLEFAEHVSAPRTAAGAGFTFNVKWTPPATDVGNVILYAAGNAANGDGGLLGDRIYTTVKTVSPNRACSLTQKPAVTAVQNGGSFLPVIGPGGMISILGSGFRGGGSALEATGADFVDNGYPKQFSCIAVEVDGKRAPLTYVSNGQINAQAPFNLNAGPATVRVLANPGLANQIASDPSTATVQTLSPAFFSFGGGEVAATVPNSSTPIANGIPGSVAAKPGDVITLWATGLGSANAAAAEGVIVPAVAQFTGTIALSIGGISIPAADILYAGLSPGSISGLNQKNIRLPAGLPDGKAPVSLQV